MLVDAVVTMNGYRWLYRGYNGGYIVGLMGIVLEGIREFIGDYVVIFFPYTIRSLCG